MQQFTRCQATAILVLVLVICGLLVPNFVSDEKLRGWPNWAQRRVTLAPELRGGTSLLLEVDRDHVRKHVLTSLLREVRYVVHHDRVSLANPVTVRSGSVEVRPRAGDFGASLSKLRELSQAFNGVRLVEVTDTGDGLIRVTPTESAIREYEPLIVDQSIRNIAIRLFDLTATVEREGANRIRVRIPRLGPEAISHMAP